MSTQQFELVVVVEKGDRNLSAYVPDVLGCVTTGKDLDDLRANMKEALEVHLTSMAEDGDPMPVVRTRHRELDIAGHRYAVLIEQGQIQVFAFAPDVPEVAGYGFDSDEAIAALRRQLEIAAPSLSEPSTECYSLSMNISHRAAVA
ncbi:MAG: type II toxin-antitoxin system HicB family antitoxin [Sumerlaeia bacterium]